MQFDLVSDPRTEILQYLHDRLIAEFGRIIRPPEKRRDPIWALVQGVIGPRTKTIHSNKATDDLIAAYGDWDAVAQASEDALAKILKPVTFPNQMAQRLKACLSAIIARQAKVCFAHLADMETQAAMDWLEKLPGVARKNSAGVMNTSTLNRKALVIDGHHLRVMQRMGLVAIKVDTQRAYDELMPILPSSWTAEDMDEHHLIVKRLGQTYCGSRRKDCLRCPASANCKTGLNKE